MGKILFLLSIICLLGCKDPELTNPIEGCWVISEYRIGSISINLDSCIGQSNITISSKSYTDQNGEFLFKTYYYDSAEMTCEIWEYTEKWRHYEGEYTIVTKGVDQNEQVELTPEDQLIYYYEAWEFKYDSLGDFEEIATTPIVTTYSRSTD
jgi:nitrate reductase beta subunit